jgi:hypothetical protein
MCLPIGSDKSEEMEVAFLLSIPSVNGGQRQEVNTHGLSPRGMRKLNVEDQRSSQTRWDSD